MKPAKFDYYDPSTIEEALALLSQHGDDARPLAGGQSLVPLMNFRLLRPGHLIDLNGIAALNFLQADAGELRIGATTRQRQLERSSEVGARWPLLRDATSYIGHAQIRNRGKVGGSLAHAFPSAELPVAMVTLGATFLLRTKTAQRMVAADGFFISFMTSALQPGELLVEMKVPATPPNTGWTFCAPSCSSSTAVMRSMPRAATAKYL
jgi:CO/xanthine dehydrogenase FAD-binding subunit